MNQTNTKQTMNKGICTRAFCVSLFCLMLAIFLLASISNSENINTISNDNSLTNRPRLVVQLGHSKDMSDAKFSPDEKFILTSATDGVVCLWETVSGRELRCFSVTSGSVSSVAFSPDGSLILTSSADSIARLYETVSGREVRQFRGHKGGVWAVGFSKDGKLIVTGGSDGARLWDAATGNELRRFIGHKEQIYSVVFSSDGQRLVTGSYDKTARIWDVATGNELMRFDGHTESIRDVHFTLDGKSLITSSGDNTARLWDLATGKEIRRFEPKNASSLWSSAISPDGKLLALGMTKAFLLFDIASGVEVKRLQGLANYPMSLMFSSDGRSLLSALSGVGRKGGKAVLLNISTGREQQIFQGQAVGLNDAAFSPDGRLLLTKASGGTAYLWDNTTGKLVHRIGGDGNTGDIYVIALSPDGRWLATAGRDDAIVLWNTETGEEVRQIRGHSDYVWSLAFSPDNKLLVSGSEDNTARVWDVESGNEVFRFQQHSDAIGAAAFSTDGLYVASGGKDKTVRLWRVEDGTEKFQLTGHTASVLSVTFSLDGKMIATGSEDNTVRLWDSVTGKEIKRFEVPSTVLRSVMFSPDGRLLAACALNPKEAGSKIIVWNVESGAEVFNAPELEKNRFYTTVTFSPDERLLAATAYNPKSGTSDMFLWDTETKREIARADGGNKGLWSVLFTRDGRYLITGGIDSRARLWSVDGLKEVGSFGTKPLSVLSDPVIFAPDGKTFAIASAEDVVIFDTESGNEVKRMRGVKSLSWISSIAFSPDGRFLAVGYAALGSEKNTAIVWDVNRESAVHVLQSQNDKTATAWFGVKSITFSPDGRFVYVGSEDSSLCVWDLTLKKEVNKFKPHNGFVYSLDVSQDGKTLAFAGSYGAVLLLDAASGQVLKRFAGDNNDVVSVSFSPDERYIVAGGFDQTVRVWETATGRLVRQLKGHTNIIRKASFSPDGRFIVSASDDGTTRFWNAQTGSEICQLITLPDGTWIVIDNEGRFDTNNLEEVSGLHWIMPDDPTKPLPLEIFMRDYYEPQLLSRLLLSEKMRSVPDLSKLNRLQPQINIISIEQQPDTPDTVTVKIEVAQTSGADKTASGVFDLRLFRDKQMVAFVSDADTTETSYDIKAWRNQTAIKLDSNGKAVVTFSNIKLPRKTEINGVEFSAYAFNSDRVKSSTARKNFKSKYTIPQAKKRAYIITVGVNAYEAPIRYLLFAANDARRLQQLLSENLKRTGEFEEIVQISLLSDFRADDASITEKTATKENIKTVLDVLAGKRVTADKLAKIPNGNKLQTATPEDLVFISFSSHGYRDKIGQFYFLPYDIGISKQKTFAVSARRDLLMSDLTTEILERSISSEELARWLRAIDAGAMMLIADACFSSAAVEGEGFKPAPMGSRGLGQLAYDKGMLVLAATQADNVALESNKLKLSLLTYSLVQAMEQNRADLRPKDGRITLSEWVDFGVKAVPSVYQTVVKDPKIKTQQPSLFDFRKQKKDLVIKKAATQ